MESKIKMIWDFRGPDGKKIAEHHKIHLEEFAVREKLSVNITGVEVINDVHTIAYLVIEKSDMVQVRDALKPNRAQVYEG